MLHLHLRPWERSTGLQNNHSFVKQTPLTAQALPYISRSLVGYLAGAVPGSCTLAVVLVQLPLMVGGRAEPATSESGCAATTKYGFNEASTSEGKSRYPPCHSPDLFPIAFSSVHPPAARLPLSTPPGHRTQSEVKVSHLYDFGQNGRVASLSIANGGR